MKHKGETPIGAKTGAGRFGIQENRGTVRERWPITKSAVFRICAVIILLILPINVLTLILSNMMVSKTKEQISMEVENTLNLTMDNFEVMASHVEKKLTYLSFGSSDVVTMASTEFKDRAKKATLIQNIRGELQQVNMDYPWMDTVYYYFPKPDYYITYTMGIFNGRPGKDTVKELHESETPLNWKWNVMESGGEYILIYQNSWNGSKFGCMVSLENLLSNMGFSDSGKGRIVYLKNKSETIMTKSGVDYLKENNLTLEELEQGKNYYTFQSAMENSDLILTEVVEKKVLFSNLPGLISGLQYISVVLTVLAIPLLLFTMRRWFIRPINRLIQAMEKIERGNTNHRIEIQQEGAEFEQINKNFNNMMDQVKQLKINVYEKELERKSVKLRYLSQQIQPHFILNAMNIIYSYEPEEYPLIQKMVLCLSKYFRYIVKANAEFVLLKHEMEHIKNYFEIQKARYPDLFFAIVEYEEELEHALVPPLLIQNFAENAVKHSLKIGNRIKIFVVAERMGETRMRIRLADTGKGISEEVLEKIEIFRKTRKYQEELGVGIQNAIERLDYLYGDKTEFRIWQDENYTGTNVEIILPVHFSEEEIGEGFYADFTD